MNINKDRLQMYVSLMKITIVLCWLSLFSFWAIKLFGGNWFEIMVENENFIKFSNTVQNTWLKYLVSLITISISNYLMLGAVLQRLTFKGKYSLIVITSVLVSWVSANFININIVKMLGGYIVAILASILYHKGYKKLNGVICVSLDFVFGTVSMLVRNIEVSVLSNYLIAIIGSIDLFIMYGLYFLYSNLLRIIKEKK